MAGEEEILERIQIALRISDDAGVPPELQVEAFKYALSRLDGDEPRPVRGPSFVRVTPARHAAIAKTEEDEWPDAADLLPKCKLNADRFLVFLQLLEKRDEPGSIPALLELFKTYKEDIPKLPSRDLANMVVRGLIDTAGKGRNATYLLKRKGRDRLVRLAEGTEF